MTAKTIATLVALIPAVTFAQAKPSAPAKPAAPSAPAAPAAPDPALLKPSTAEMNAPAPATITVEFRTSKGTFKIEAHRAWAPHGVDRLYYLVKHGFYDGNRFFRVLPGFIVQFGLSGDPAITKLWNDLDFSDDPRATSNTRYSVTFATAGPNTRTTQLFINLANNARLDGMGFAPIGTVIDGTDVVEKLYGGYGEGAPDGAGPDQEQIVQQGNAYLTRAFPKLDYIISARIVKNLEH